MKSIGKRIPGLRAREREGALPKDVRSLGRMYREVEAEQRPVRVAWSATVIRQTAASVDEMHYQTQLELNS